MKILFSWCAYDSDFTANKFDSRFKVWINKGITSLCSITQKEVIVSFQTLMVNFPLQKQDFYRYLQLRHYYNHKLKNKDIREASKPLVQLFTKAYESNIKRGVISQLYKSLQNLETSSTKYIQEKWEREGGFTITDNEWEDICVLQWKITKSHA